MVAVAWTVDIDGTDITSICQTITWHPKLNRPASCVVRYPAHLFMIGTGTQEMHLYQDGVLKFSGPVWYLEPSGSPNDTYSEVTAYDHLIYLNKRLCKKPSATGHPNGNFIDPGSVIIANVTGPAIMRAFINNSHTIDDVAPGAPPPLQLNVGTVSGGGVDLRSVPTDFPMTLEQMRSLLCSTGQLNLIVHPGIGSSTIDLTNGGFENDLTGSVQIQYQIGAYNAQVASFTEDMEDYSTALWYLIGPRGPRWGRREWIPKNHWAGSITPTGPNSGGDGEGPLVGPGWPQLLENRILNARNIYGYAQDVRIFDDNEDEEFARPLFEEEWANEAWIRAVPKQLVNIRPQRGTAPTFAVGDLITAQAGPRLDKGFSGAQIVFEFEMVVDTEGMVEITEIVTSGDQSTS